MSALPLAVGKLRKSIVVLLLSETALDANQRGQERLTAFLQTGRSN